MEVTRQAYHTRSCPYYATIKRRKEAKGWPGPVFANEMGLGWTKLNAVRACTRCRVRHVKCSLIHSGGPCTHCRKRRETCEVLGWQLQPDEPSQTIYKYVLPPPQVPLHTPRSTPAESQFNQPLDPAELCRRLEQLSPRRLALLWPWGPDTHDPFYPIGPQFGESYGDECWPGCPQRQFTESSLSDKSEKDSFSPSYSLDFDYQSSPASSDHLQSKGDSDSYNFGQVGHWKQNPSLFKDSASHYQHLRRSEDCLENRNKTHHRMSLSFLLNSTEARISEA